MQPRSSRAGASRHHDRCGKEAEVENLSFRVGQCRMMYEATLSSCPSRVGCHIKC